MTEEEIKEVDAEFAAIREKHTVRANGGAKQLKRSPFLFAAD
jgi:hypothetical protein